MINVFFAIDLPVWNHLRSNFTRDENGQRESTDDFSDEQERQLREVHTDMWKAPHTVGAPDVLVSWYVPEALNEAGDGLQAVDDILVISPSQIEVFGAWNSDGSQYGTTIISATHDENGVEISPEEITGTPIYPQHPALLTVMPDDVTYNEDGSEASRTSAAAFKEVLKLAGWADRRWT